MTIDQIKAIQRAWEEGCFPLPRDEWTPELIDQLHLAGMLDGHASTNIPDHPANGCTGLFGRPITLI